MASQPSARGECNFRERFFKHDRITIGHEAGVWGLIVATKFSLTGDMIPRSVIRIFDHRSEERIEPTSEHAVLDFRGTQKAVTLINISGSGAMIGVDAPLNIGERVRLHTLKHEPVAAFVRWVRDGRAGLNFDAPLT